MFIWLWAQWWYGAGWGWVWQRAVVDRVAWCNNAFSLNKLIETWIAPYKQIATGKVHGSLGVHIRAFVDRLVSRVIGFLVRSALIMVGALFVLIASLTGTIFVIVWPLFPIMPLLGLILFLLGAGR